MHRGHLIPPPPPYECMHAHTRRQPPTPTHLIQHQEAEVLQGEARRPLHVVHQPPRSRHHDVHTAPPPAPSPLLLAAATAAPREQGEEKGGRRRRPSSAPLFLFFLLLLLLVVVTADERALLGFEVALPDGEPHVEADGGGEALEFGHHLMVGCDVT